MPTSISCSIASIDSSLKEPPMPMRLGGFTIEHFFSTGSKKDIDLKVVQSSALGIASGPVQMFDLHRALMLLTGNATNVIQVNKVGLILAESFAPRPTAFGFMFDRGFKFDPNLFGRVPREGCAVFVGAIGKARPAATVPEEVAFTAIHELGHVFNLFHIEQPDNLMASDPSLTTATVKGFLPRHTRLLELCSQRREVHPGGTEFGDLGTLDKGPDDPFRNPSLPAKPGLRLSISMQREEFWHFEPVELDITLSIQRGMSAAVDVPDALDPGYEIFRIWIEEPSGERRLYRSSKYFCTPPGTIRIAPGVPFRRDLSIFGQSGDYTFMRVGEHRIRAEFVIPEVGRLRSNEIVVNVLPTTIRDRVLTKAKPILERPDVARLLFYRTGSRRSKAFRELEGLARSIRSAPAAAGIHYALGRAVLKELPKRHPAATLNTASDHLKRAVDHPQLSPHRREIAERLLTEIAEV